MSPTISASLLADPDLAPTVQTLQELLSRKFLPGLGQDKQNMAEKAYTEQKRKFFVLVSEKLGREASSPTPSELIRRVNQAAVYYFAVRMWHRVRSQKYSPFVFVALLALFLSLAAPAIYAGLSDCERSSWVVLGTVAAIVCDIVEATAIECTIVFTAKTARQTLSQVILPVMGIAKFAGTVGKVAGEMSVQAASEVAGEAILMYRRFVTVIHSQPTWDVVAGSRSDSGSPGNWLSREEELVVMGLVLEQH